MKHAKKHAPDPKNNVDDCTEYSLYYFGDLKNTITGSIFLNFHFSIVWTYAIWESSTDASKVSNF